MTIRQSILVVEDEALIAHSIDYLLRKLGYAVVGICNNAQETINAVLSQRPDLVLMDINLNSDKDGIQIAEEIQTLEYQPPVIFLTAYADADTVSRAKLMQPFGYIVKPFQERELSICIEMALYKHQTERRLRQQELKFETTLRSIGMPVITTGVAGKIEFSNYLAQRLLGSDDLVGNDFKPGDWTWHLPWDSTAHLQEPVRYACQSGIVLTMPEGSQLRWQNRVVDTAGCTISPIVSEEGAPLGAVIVFKALEETA